MVVARCIPRKRGFSFVGMKTSFLTYLHSLLSISQSTSPRSSPLRTKSCLEVTGRAQWSLILERTLMQFEPLTYQKEQQNGSSGELLNASMVYDIGTSF